ncbi:hypothetical protein ACP4DD_06965 [Parvimonas sp. G1425]
MMKTENLRIGGMMMVRLGIFSKMVKNSLALEKMAMVKDILRMENMQMDIMKELIIMKVKNSTFLKL